MDTKDTLGIIVNSNRYFDFVVNLAEAAADHDKAVHIHLVCGGCQFATTDACMRLSFRVRITMCSKSAQKIAHRFGDGIKDSISLVPPQELTKLLNDKAAYTRMSGKEPKTVYYVREAAEKAIQLLNANKAAKDSPILLCAKYLTGKSRASCIKTTEPCAKQ